MTDLYPDEEGFLSDGCVVGFCQADAAIALHSAVFIGGTSTSGAILVAAGTADGDSVGVALKAASAAGEEIPVCFHGIVKMVIGDTCTAGDIVMNDASATYVLPIKAFTEDEILKLRGLNGTGTYCRLGLLMQAGAASGDEALVVIGRIA